ncbi:MAG: hypothetical protein A2270_10170 [Elusimicrobia bacterium RIFOXYA12_FULL_51_18]|nr:MAG: hypothetical protein A2270_10170 [Elusimicrobia bacterium RIFOXYA12_FULL_51_18]OGS29631.1 MAG: hypothetical protein A2218_01020 [Elusimicrobia bacterium RIFOXYA2_FULL_53_38]
MNDWRSATQKFTAKWLVRKDVSGILICGSYITGNPSKHSDIDVCIVLRDNVGWRARGNKIIDGFLFEYFANSPQQIMRYFMDEHKAHDKRTAHMFVTGKIVCDKNGRLKKIKKEANKWLSKKFIKPSARFCELSKYQLWDISDNLEDVYETRMEDFAFLCYSNLPIIFDIYSRFVRYGNVPPDKILQFLKGRDLEKYHMSAFPDRQFAELYVKTAVAGTNAAMMSAYSRLINHVFARMGGFKIDGWKIKTPLDMG